MLHPLPIKLNGVTAKIRNILLLFSIVESDTHCEWKISHTVQRLPGNFNSILLNVLSRPIK